MYDFTRGFISMITHWMCTKGLFQDKIYPQINHMSHSSMIIYLILITVMNIISSSLIVIFSDIIIYNFNPFNHIYTHKVLDPWHHPIFYKSISE